jgi:hypothetical protein
MGYGSGFKGIPRYALIIADHGASSSNRFQICSLFLIYVKNFSLSFIFLLPIAGNKHVRDLKKT